MTINCPSCQTAIVVPGAPPVPPPSRPAGAQCPRCGAALETGAILCTSCGMNLRTGKKVQPQTAASPSPRPLGSGIGRVHKIGIGLLLFFGALFGLAFTNQTIAWAYHAVQLLFGLVVGIMVIVNAFQESAGQGFLTLCVPCYALYFVYARCESALIKWLFTIAILTRVAGFALPVPDFMR